MCGGGGMCAKVIVVDLQVGREIALIFKLFHFNGIALTKILLRCAGFAGFMVTQKKYTHKQKLGHYNCHVLADVFFNFNLMIFSWLTFFMLSCDMFSLRGLEK